MAGEREWIVAELEDAEVLAVNDGYRAKNEELSQTGLPFARAGNINGGFIFTDADRFPEDRLGKVGIKISQSGDVVFTSKGTVGRFAYVRPDTPRFVYSPQLCFWRSLKPAALDSRYLYYWMTGPDFTEQCDGVKSQTDMADYVSLRDQRAMRVVLPEIGVQRAIAHVLGTLDDKIELNQRMNVVLGEFARAVFEKWCAENDPQVTTESAQALCDRGILIIGDGYRAKRSELAATGLPFARAGNLDGGFNFDDAEYLGEGGVSAAKEKISRDFDAVFTSKGTVGRIAQVLPTTPRFVFAPQLCYWRVLKPDVLSPDVLFQWMKGAEFREQLDSLKGQTDMADYVSLGDQRDMDITLPFSADSRRVSAQLRLLSLRIDANSAQSKTLATLRDALLPRLLSGELRLKDAERAVGEVV